MSEVHAYSLMLDADHGRGSQMEYGLVVDEGQRSRLYGHGGEMAGPAERCLYELDRYLLGRMASGWVPLNRVVPEQLTDRLRRGHRDGLVACEHLHRIPPWGGTATRANLRSVRNDGGWEVYELADGFRGLYPFAPGRSPRIVAYRASEADQRPHGALLDLHAALNAAGLPKMALDVVISAESDWVSVVDVLSYDEQPMIERPWAVRRDLIAQLLREADAPAAKIGLRPLARSAAKHAEFRSGHLLVHVGSGYGTRLNTAGLLGA